MSGSGTLSPMTPDLPAPPVPQSTRRHIDLTKIGEGRYKATNARGGVVAVGSGDDPDFTPVELLLAAIAGCSAADVDAMTRKRAAADSFTVTTSGHKVRDESGNHLIDLSVTLDVTFPAGEGGDAARAVLPRSVEQTRDRLCTVGRTVQLGEPIAYGLAGE